MKNKLAAIALACCASSAALAQTPPQGSAHYDCLMEIRATVAAGQFGDLTVAVGDVLNVAPNAQIRLTIHALRDAERVMEMLEARDSLATCRTALDKVRSIWRPLTAAEKRRAGLK